jgi:hypothetical protein
MSGTVEGAFHRDAHELSAIRLECSKRYFQIVRQAFLDDAFVLLVDDGEEMIV